MSDREGGRDGAVRAAIVSVGNELLYGETVDTNAAWLGRTLTAWGATVVAGWTVRDVAEEIRGAVRDAMGRAELVVITGGLGPTDDDLTKASVADLLGRPMVVDEATRARVRTRFQEGGHDGTPRISEGQSEIPDGAQVLPNERGTAPGVLLEHEGRHLVMVPGVPSEMKAIVDGPLRDALEERRVVGARVRHRTIHTTGIFESHLAEKVQPAWSEMSDDLRDRVGLAFLPDELGVDLRLSARAGVEADAERDLDRAEAALAPILAPWRFEAGSGDLAEAVVDALSDAGLDLAVAESCTGGLLGARVTAIPGASSVFVGGVIAYDNRVKREELGVPAELLDREGAVSEAVACAMAVGVAERLEADVGVSITGVAGPGGGSDEKPVGTVWIGWSIRGEIGAEKVRFPGDRGAVRRRAAQAALRAVHRRLPGKTTTT